MSSNKSWREVGAHRRGVRSEFPAGKITGYALPSLVRATLTAAPLKVSDFWLFRMETVRQSLFFSGHVVGERGGSNFSLFDPPFRLKQTPLKSERMAGFEQALILLLILAGLSVAGERLPWPMPITYVTGGTLLAFWPAFPAIELDPGFFFLCFVPPLLFADGWLMPLRDFWSVKRPVFTLATGLVVVTTVAVGLVAYELIPGLPLAMAFALGAVVSPTDAVAVSVITRKLKVPPRLTAVLNGESLMNDATGLVAFKFALAAAAVGTFSFGEASLSFLVVALGGLALGLVISWLVGKGRDLLQRVHGMDPLVETTISLLTPFAVYLAAEALELSSILAVVAAGLYSGWRDPLHMDATTRQITWKVWSLLLFWLNGLAFVLLGLQLPEIFQSLSAKHSPGELLLFTAAISGTAILVRLLWFGPGTHLTYRIFRRGLRGESPPPRTWLAVASWAGMRGTITLAAALSIPVLMENGTPFPGREMVIFLAAGTIVVTLLLQGMTLETLIWKLKVRPDDTQIEEDRIARIAAVEAGLQYLRDEARDDEGDSAALAEILAEYESRLAELTAEGETQSHAICRRRVSREHRLAALKTEREAVDTLWRRHKISDEIHRPLQHLLDYEEAMLEGGKR
jgi:monovalent cation/hydrogen antiporter